MQPYPIYGLPGERVMRFYRFILTQLQQRGIIDSDNLILDSKIQYKAYHGAHFLQGTVRETLFFHAVDYLLEVFELQARDRHLLQHSAMPEAVVVVVDGALRRFDIGDMDRQPAVKQFSEGHFMAGKGAVKMFFHIVDLVNFSLRLCFKIRNGFTPPVWPGDYKNKWPPPVTT